MYRTVQLDRNPRLGTVKIGDIVRAKRVLAAEFQSIQTACAQTLPEGVFGLGGVPAQLASEFEQGWIQTSESAVNLGVGWDLSLGGLEIFGALDLSPCPLSIGWRGGKGVRLGSPL